MPTPSPRRRRRPRAPPRRPAARPGSRGAAGGRSRAPPPRPRVRRPRPPAHPTGTAPGDPAGIPAAAPRARGASPRRRRPGSRRRGAAVGRPRPRDVARAPASRRAAHRARSRGRRGTRWARQTCAPDGLAAHWGPDSASAGRRVAAGDLPGRWASRSRVLLVTGAPERRDVSGGRRAAPGSELDDRGGDGDVVGQAHEQAGGAAVDGGEGEAPVGVGRAGALASRLAQLHDERGGGRDPAVDAHVRAVVVRGQRDHHGQALVREGDRAGLEGRGVAAHRPHGGLDQLQLHRLGLELRERHREQRPLDQALGHRVDHQHGTAEAVQDGDVVRVQGLVLAGHRRTPCVLVLLAQVHEASPCSVRTARSLARHRPRVAPMLPTGIPIDAEIAL